MRGEKRLSTSFFWVGIGDMGFFVRGFNEFEGLRCFYAHLGTVATFGCVEQADLVQPTPSRSPEVKA